MKNDEKLKIIQYHWNQLGQDCPCTYSIPRDKITVDDPKRMPKDETEEAQWQLEYDNRIDLTDQKTACIKLLDDSEKHVSMHPPYPNDVQLWVTAREQWRTVLKSDKPETIPPKPFS